MTPRCHASAQQCGPRAFDPPRPSTQSLFRYYRLVGATFTRALAAPSNRLVGGAVPDELHVLGGSNADRSPQAVAAAAATAVQGLQAPPLPLAPPSPVLCGLPEWSLTSLLDFLVWAHRMQPRTVILEMPEATARDFLTFLTAYISAPLHVHNPFVRAKLVDAIAVLVPIEGDPWRDAASPHRPPPVYSVFPGHAFAATALLPALVSWHVMCSTAGTHTGEARRVHCNARRRPPAVAHA